MKKILNKNFFLILIFILFGIFLRLNHLRDNNLTFAYDQARDAYVASQIANGDLKILGPPVSSGGFYHGVLYYYFIALPYFLFKGNPIGVAIFLSFFSIAFTPLVYLLGKKLFTKKVALLASLFYIISFDLVQYSNWLSNPSLAVPFSIILYLGLTFYFFTNQKKLGIILSAIGYALCFQSQFFLGYLIIPIFFLIHLFKAKIKIKDFFLFSCIVLLLISTMILSYLKFGFTFIEGFKTVLVQTDKFSSVDIDFFNTLKLVLVRFVENFYRVVFPFKSFFAFVFAFLCFLFLSKQIKTKSPFSKQIILLIVFLVSQAIIIPFGGTSTPYINVGLQIPVILLSSFFIISLFQKHKIFSSCLILFLVFVSIQSNLKYNKYGQILFSIQKGLTIRNEMQVLDYTYRESQGNSFSINTVTSPYWVNTLWSYLYQWYGQKKYGYTPTFRGRDQSGQLSFLSSTTTDTKNYFLIIEPNNGIPQYLIDDSIAYENSFSTVLEQKNFNGVVIQKRQLTKPFNKINFVK